MNGFCHHGSVSDPQAVKMAGKKIHLRALNVLGSMQLLPGLSCFHKCPREWSGLQNVSFPTICKRLDWCHNSTWFELLWLGIHIQLLQCRNRPRWCVSGCLHLHANAGWRLWLHQSSPKNSLELCQSIHLRQWKSMFPWLRQCRFETNAYRRLICKGVFLHGKPKPQPEASPCRTASGQPEVSPNKALVKCPWRENSTRSACAAPPPLAGSGHRVGHT